MPDLHVYLPDPAEEAWRKQAACIDVWKTDPDLFFPAVGAPSTTKIEALCLSCPVNNDCLKYAIDENIKIGWWGGIPPRGRRKLRRYMREGLRFEDAVRKIRRERLEELGRSRAMEMVAV